MTAPPVHHDEHIESGDEEHQICFVKAYARKPVGNPTANLIPKKKSSRHQNGLPESSEHNYWYDEFAPAETRHRAEREHRDLDYEWEKRQRKEQFERDFYGTNGEDSDSGVSEN